MKPKKKREPNWTVVMITDRSGCPFKYNDEKPFKKIDGKCYYWGVPRNCTKKECTFSKKNID